MRFFANTITHKNITNFKSIILLNADSLTLDAQSALRRSIEIYNHTKFFIVTANKSKIIKPILSRFSEIYCNEKNMNVHNIRVLTIGGKYIWEESGDINCILSSNDIYHKNTILSDKHEKPYLHLKNRK